MAYTTTSILSLCDSISQLFSDFNADFVIGTATGNPSSSTMIAGISGGGATNTYGRILNSVDSLTELGLLTPTYAWTVQVAAYLTGLQNPNGLYQQCFGIFDKLDTTVGGLSTYLSVNSLQVNGYFAKAFNLFCSVAVQLGIRTSANIPTPIASGNYFPSSNVDSLWTFTTGAGTAMTASAVGTNANTSVAGGGVGQVVIYKSNVGAAAGIATLSITYKNAAGTNSVATYTTAVGTPAASGSLATGYIVSGAIGSQIVSVSGTGMTSGEQYTLGVRQIRALSGY